MSTTTNTNLLASLTAGTTTNTRKLQFTEVLQGRARELTTDLLKRATSDEQLGLLGNQMLRSGTPESLLEFITAGMSADTIKSASELLTACPADELGKMLESQRSNRSKAKKSGLDKMPAVVQYVSSMLAELIIRERSGKAYRAGGTLPTDHAALRSDPDALVKRINSLASKKSRLSKLAVYDATAAAELANVEAELAELRSYKPSKRTTTVKAPKLDDLKSAIAAMSAEERAQLLAAMSEAAAQ